jgi:peptidoglycan/LPS O-acetylase OafA/YrhL
MDGAVPAAAAAPPRIRGLDGLRAFSITLVLFAHLAATRGFGLPHAATRILYALGPGYLGVRVFFVISGFLITTLLLGEYARSGTVSLGRFYFRRTLRIFPPFYLYVGVVAALSWAELLTLRDGDLLHAITYTVNYHQQRAWHLGHAWSLSVEEQFYLLWPALFRWLGPKRSVPCLTGYLLLAPLWRMAVALLLPQWRLAIGETFFTTADAIATGCLLAILRPRILAWQGYRRWVDSGWFALVLPALLLASAAGRFAKLDWLVGSTAQNLLIAVALERLTRDTSWMASVLNFRPVVLLGLWSYSVYLWQQMFLNGHDQHSWWTAFPFNLAAVLCVAATSYYAVERPALRLRERLERRWFAATRPGHSPSGLPVAARPSAGAVTDART